MSESRRWWGFPKMLSSLQIWRENPMPLHSAATTATVPDSPNSLTDSKKSSDNSSEYEDMEEFVERQREARLGFLRATPYYDEDQEPENTNSCREFGSAQSCDSSKVNYLPTPSSSSCAPEELYAGDEENERKCGFEESTMTVEEDSCDRVSVNPENICEPREEQTFTIEDLNESLDMKRVDQEQMVSDEKWSDGRELDTLEALPSSSYPVTADTAADTAAEGNNQVRHVSKLTITLQSTDINTISEKYDLTKPTTVGALVEAPQTRNDAISEIPDLNESTAVEIFEEANAVVDDDTMPIYENDFVVNEQNRNSNDMEYCEHLIEMKCAAKRRDRIRRSSVVRINKAWKSLAGWWSDEKYRIGRVVHRTRARFKRREFDEEQICCPPNDNSDCSELSEKNSKSPDELEQSHERSLGRSATEISDPATLSLSSSTSCQIKLTIDDEGATIERQKSMSRRQSSIISADYQLFHRHDYSRPQSCYSDICQIGSNRFPRRNPPHPPPSRTSGISAFRRSKCVQQGQEGFEELRRYVKQGGDFCKELSVILQERSEAEIQYAKTLSKLSTKLLKTSKDSSLGTVAQAWHKAILEMEAIGEIHRTFATALSEEVVKPLKQLLETQHRIRKSVEAAVDKTSKSLSEWRSAESKSKKQSFMNARENEKLQDMLLDIRLNGGSTSVVSANKLTASTLHLHHQRPSSEKECNKLDAKRRKAEELVKKSDVEYYTYCIRAERARLEWETAVMRGSHCFQVLEEERLQQLKNLGYSYWQHCQDIGPKLVESALRLKEPFESCDINADIKTIATLKGVQQPVSEQLLPDFYAEHMTLAMNRERRRQALVKILQLIIQDLERERRSKNGVENLARAFKQTPMFGADDSQQNVSEKLHHMKYMLTYLEAARYKVTNALAEVDGKPKTSHPLSSHIHVVRDKQGLQQSTLKVPAWINREIEIPQDKVESLDWKDRGTADGNSVQPDSDFDEFSSQSSSEKDFDGNAMSVISDSSSCATSSARQCKALYPYSANLYDELNLQPGDIINIHEKQPDGWWLGELNGVVGIFPATYVQEII